MNERLKAIVKEKLRKQAGILNVAKHSAIPLAYGATSTLAQTQDGSRPSYYATDMLRNSLDGGLYFSKHVPNPLKVGAMVFNPLGGIKALNRKDPLAENYVPGKHEFIGG